MEPSNQQTRQTETDHPEREVSPILGMASSSPGEPDRANGKMGPVDRQMDSAKMRRVWAMPNCETFSIEPIHNLVRKYLTSSVVSIDPFARNCRWATFTNDLSPETMADSHLEAGEFLLELCVSKIRADLIIFDPPYSLEQCARSYQSVGRKVTSRDTQIFGRWNKHKRLMDELLKPGGIVLSFGWNSNGMGMPYEIEEILLVAHGAGHNDTICIAERKVQSSLEWPL